MQHRNGTVSGHAVPTPRPTSATSRRLCEQNLQVGDSLARLPCTGTGPFRV
jgi:hypothetical protein